MLAEDLVTLASARGVDLLRAAKMASDRKRDASRKNGKNGKNGVAMLLPPPASQANGKETRSVLRPTWTIAELGSAAAGVPKTCFHAVCFSIAGDRSRFWALQQRLYQKAVVLQEERQWPLGVRDVHGIESPYLAHLSTLVLDEDMHYELFRVHPPLYSFYMRVTEKVWDRQLQGRFEELKLIWLGWIDEATRRIQSKLSA